MHETRNSRQGRGKWEIILIVSMVMVVLISVAFCLVTSATSKKINSTIAAIQSRGEPVTLKDLVPEPIPDAVNAALVYNGAFKMVSTTGKTNPDNNTIKSFVNRDERLKNRQLWRDAKTLIDKKQPMFTALATASRMPECQFPVKWQSGFSTLFPHYAPLRELSRWNAADALLKAKAGDMDAAADAIETGIRMSNSIKDEHFMISILVRVSMLQTALAALHDCAEIGSINAVQAQQLDAALSQIDMADGFVNSMMGERAQGFDFFDGVQSKHFTHLEGLFGDGCVQGYASRILGTSLGRPLLNSDKEYYARFMAKQIELARMPYYKYEKARKTVKLDPYLDAPKYALLSRVICPVFGRARLVSDTADASVAVTHTGLGLIAYRERYGCYPQALSELSAKLRWSVPKDPFTGKSLVYKRTENGFTLYSVGSNMVDEGGKAPDPRKSPTDADVVWKYSVK